MSTPTYSQSDVYNIILGMSRGKFGQVQDRQVTVNRAARAFLSEVDLRSAKRSAALSPYMMSTQYYYAAPTDLKAEKIIDIRKQVNRNSFEKFTLVDDLEFDRYKGIIPYRVALRDENFGKVLRLAGVEGTTSVQLNACDSITANGTWAASGDATNLTLDTQDFVEGSGSLNFDTNTGATTAILSHSFSSCAANSEALNPNPSISSVSRTIKSVVVVLSSM